RNAGRAHVPLEWKDLAPPFEIVLVPLEAESGSNDVLIRARPLAAGTWHAVLAFDSEGRHQEAELEISATDTPQCPQTDACTVSTFDEATHRCEEQVLPDGSACDTQSVCVSAGTCQSGRCVGTP